LARRARRTVNWDLDRQFDQISLGASWQAVSSSYDDLKNENPLGGYTLFGLRSSWALNREIKLDLKVDNVFDKGYSRANYSYDGSQYGYREEGRVWMFGVTWTPQL
jgi:vitamin B12 transporter